VKSEISVIHGVGIDIADVGRIERLVRTHGDRFARRWFTGEEIAQCNERIDCAAEYSKRFAAKEAIWKALRLQGWAGPVPWRLISVLRASALDAVRVELAGDVERAAARLRVGQICVDFRTIGPISVAVALVERDQH
jgi:holo-[acyl-carrier protein] synthase